MKKLFGTSGIRGTDDFFTNEFCIRIGKAFAKFLIKKKYPKKVVVGIDIRQSSEKILKAVITGIESGGFECIYGGVIPTPCLNFFSKNYNCAGIIVTGSHLSNGQNGIKFFLKDREILDDDENIIESNYAKLNDKIMPLSKLPKIDSFCIKNYKEKLLKKAKDFSGIKIIIDAGHGTQQFIMDEVFTKAGAKVIKMNWGVENFTGVDTEVSDAFKKTQERVVQEKADLAVIYDSDGDRSIYVDDTGQVVPGDVIGALISRDFHADTIVTAINTSSVIDQVGKKIVRTKVGSPRIIEVMLANNLPFGFESNGGLIFADLIYSRDGGMTSIFVMNLIKKTGKSLSELVKELPKFYIEKDKIDCPSKLNGKIINAMKKKYSKYEQNELDGLKIMLGEADWILFRPSGNAPEFRVFAESKSIKESKVLVKEGLIEVKKIIREKTID